MTITAQPDAATLAARQKVMEQIEANLTALRALPETGYVVQFDNGLAVRFEREGDSGPYGKATICSLVAATVFDRLPPACLVIRNGLNEVAKVRRMDMAKRVAIHDTMAAAETLRAYL